MVKPISLNTLSSQKLTGLFKDPVQGDPPKEVKGGFTPAELKASFKSDVVYSIPVNEEWFNLENRRLATRRAIDPEAVQSMGESIKTHGQEQPVKCRWDETNRLQIILGETRTHACKLIGKEVLVLITDADERTCKAWALSENLQRNDMKGYDQALKMYELQKENFSVDEISIIANKKKALIYQTFKIFDYPKITEALEAGKITISDARLLASTTSSKSLEEGLQVKAIEALSAGTLKVSDLDYFADKKGDIPLATAPAAPGQPGAPTDPASKSDDSSKPKTKSHTAKDDGAYFKKFNDGKIVFKATAVPGKTQMAELKKMKQAVAGFSAALEKVITVASTADKGKKKGRRADFQPSGKNECFQTFI